MEKPAEQFDVQAKRERFPLVRYFAVTSLICTLIIAVSLGWAYQFFALRDLTRLAEEHNTALSRSLANALWPRYTGIIAAGQHAAAEELRAIADAGQLQAIAKQQMQGTNVVKIKIYALNGMTVFSTDASQIGQDRKSNPGFLSAAAGKPRSELIHRDSFDTFEGTLNDLDVFTTYLPMLDDQQRILAVLEIYSNVTGLVRQTQTTRWQLVGSVLGLLGLLYVLLYLLVRRAQSIIDAQASAMRGYVATIEESNRDLDARIRERTLSLSQLNETLRREIDVRHAAEANLALAATVFENSIEGITITDSSEKILAVNRAFTQITGFTAEEALGKTPRMLSSGRHDPEFYEAVWNSLGQNGHWRGEIWNRRKNGDIYPELLSISVVRDANHGAVSNYVAVFSDISAIKETQARLEELAHHDTLTGLPNRMLFTSRLEHAIQRAQRSKEALAVLFLDLDHFKQVNDTLGHDIGDLLLREVAARLKGRLRETDTLARLGGDEFIVLLDRSVEPRTVAQVAHKLVAGFSAPFFVSGHELFVTVSVGIALHPDDGSDVLTLVQHADTAMYEAKTHGRNAYHFYEPSMTTFAVERLNTEMMLRKSVVNGELRLHYQPQIDLVSGELVGAEALVRWQHPVNGLMPPLSFIRIAEESGQISEIGAWVLHESCRQFAAWRDEGIMLPRIAVNISAKQLERDDFVAMVQTVLAEFSMPPECLELELTESVIMGTDNAIGVLDELNALGVEIAIDDFGTGYSSLSHLKRLPINKLKIDRSFILDIATDPHDVAIVRSVIALARTMGLTTVAEGVEDQGQLAFLRDEGCEHIQGFLIGHPVPSEQLAILLNERFRDQVRRIPVSAD